MDREKIEKLRKNLLKEKKKIENELNKIAFRNPKQKRETFDVRFPQYGTAPDENAQEVADYERLKALEYELENRLNQINKTIKKIEDGSYGICQSCSKPIEDSRLKAMPIASLCLFCAKKNK